MNPPRLVTLGRVAGVFGIKGWVKVHSYTRPAENILKYPRWTVVAGQSFETKWLEGRVQGRGIVARITGADGVAIDGRDAAAALVGAEIAIERERLAKAPAGSWYWSDLIGLEVRSTAGEALGRVTEVIDNGAQDVLVIADEAIQRMIPFVPDAIIRSVDVEAGVIVAEWSPDW